ALGHGDRRLPPSCGHRGAPQPQAHHRRARSTRDTDRPRARARASSPASAGSLARSKAEGRDLAWSELEPAVDVLLLVEADPAGRQAQAERLGLRIRVEDAQDEPVAVLRLLEAREGDVAAELERRLEWVAAEEV